MKIPANKCIMTIRYTQYRNIDFITEHKKLVDRFGSVWMLKVGRKIPIVSLEEVARESGIIILKAPKVAGGQFYIAPQISYRNGMPLKDFNYPEYYEDMIDSQKEYEITLDGTWLEIGIISPLPADALNSMLMKKSGKKLLDVIGSTRTSIMYAVCESELVL